MTRRMYAWVATDSTGAEGVVCVPLPSPLSRNETQIMPLVTCERAIAYAMTPHAQFVAQKRRVPVRLVAYIECDVLNELLPSRKVDQ